jgi:hypothetical protein
MTKSPQGPGLAGDPQIPASSREPMLVAIYPWGNSRQDLVSFILRTDAVRSRAPLIRTSYAATDMFHMDWNQVVELEFVVSDEIADQFGEHEEAWPGSKVAKAQPPLSPLDEQLQEQGETARRYWMSYQGRASSGHQKRLRKRK